MAADVDPDMAVVGDMDDDSDMLTLMLTWLFILTWTMTWGLTKMMWLLT